MAKILSTLAIIGLAFGTEAQSQIAPIAVSRTAAGASDPIPEAFVSFSIEFVFFPDFAGRLLSQP